MDRSLDLLSHYKNSFTYDEDSRQLQSIFVDLFDQIFGEQMSDLHYYGMPHLGSPKVVERFTKQDGLVVLRRPTSSDLIMRIIYANWKSLASKRGLGFLEFVLQMLIGDQWEIHRLYHSIERADVYPKLAMPYQTANSFLTSRIMIDLDQDVDIEEILEFAPILFRLVPANIVPTLSSNVGIEDMEPLHIGIGCIPYMTANFASFSDN